MKIELKVGLYGVDREKRVWGPFSETPLHKNAESYPFTEGFYSWTKSGRFLVGSDKEGMDILNTFTTKRDAVGFAKGKPVKPKKKPINYQRLALSMSKAKTIKQAREIYTKGTKVPAKKGK